MNADEIVSGYSYFAKHLPSGEDWYILGIDTKNNRVCVAGWPPTMGKLSDCTGIKLNKPLTDSETKYINEQFGSNWK